MPGVGQVAGVTSVLHLRDGFLHDRKQVCYRAKQTKSKKIQIRLLGGSSEIRIARLFVAVFANFLDVFGCQRKRRPMLLGHAETRSPPTDGCDGATKLPSRVFCRVDGGCQHATIVASENKLANAFARTTINRGRRELVTSWRLQRRSSADSEALALRLEDSRHSRMEDRGLDAVFAHCGKL